MKKVPGGNAIAHADGAASATGTTCAAGKFVASSWRGIWVLVFVGLVIGCGGGDERGSEEKDAGGAYRKVFREGDLKVTLSLDKDTATPVDLLNLTAEIEMAAPDEEFCQVHVPEIEAATAKEMLGEFGVTESTGGSSELVRGGTLRSTLSLELEPPVQPGDYELPVLTFRTRQGEGGEVEGPELQTESLPVTVRSILPEGSEAEEIREIALPVEVTRKIPWWLWPVIGGALLVAVGILLVALRRRPGAEPPAGPPIPAHEIALFGLDKLIAERLPEKGEYKIFYQRISDILRNYIEDRFGWHAPEQTTEEFLRELRSGDALAQADQSLLERFLQHCDLVKFAEHHPSGDDIEQTTSSCRSFVLETREGGETLEAK